MLMDFFQCGLMKNYCDIILAGLNISVHRSDLVPGQRHADVPHLAADHLPAVEVEENRTPVDL